VKLVADAPPPGHGDTDESPTPEPNVTRRIVIAPMTAAPPKIAAHDIADTGDSVSGVCGPSRGPLAVEIVLVGMPVLRSVTD